MLARFPGLHHAHNVQKDYRQDATNHNNCCSVVLIRFDSVNCGKHETIHETETKKMKRPRLEQEDTLSLPITRESIPSPVINIIMNSPNLWIT